MIAGRSAHVLCRSRQREAGLSLVELMIGMLIGLLIVGGMISLFVGNKQTYRYNDELARVQENSRFATETIQRTLRMAGHIGCPMLQQIGTPTVQDQWISDPAGELEDINAIAAEQFSGTYTGVVTDLGLTAVNGSEVITVTYGEGAAATMNRGAGYNGGDSLVIQSNALGFDRDENLLISDCGNVGLFRVSNAPAAGNNVTLEFNTSGGANVTDEGFGLIAFGDEARIMRLRTTTFFIGPSQRTNRQGQTFNSLYIASPDAASEAVEGVVDMIVRYGVPALPLAPRFKEADEYVDYATLIGRINAGSMDWNDIIAVRVDLLLSSVDDNAITESQNIKFNGVDYTGDRRLFTTASTTVSLRRAF